MTVPHLVHWGKTASFWMIYCHLVEQVPLEIEELIAEDDDESDIEYQDDYSENDTDDIDED